MFTVQIVCYPWDLEDQGLDRVLDRVQGELGASGITVVAAGRPVVHLRRHADASPPIFRTRGGWFFQPDEAQYANTRCKPVVSEWLKTRNPLKKTAEACAKRGLPIRVAVDTRRIGRLAARYHAMAARSAFGDVSPGIVCPSNPDVVELFGSLFDDLSSNYAVAAIEVRDLGRVLDTDLLEFAGVADSIGSAGRDLFALCFCESCRQSTTQAGIDAGAAERSGQVTLKRALDTLRTDPGSIGDAVQADPVLAAYLAHRRAAHASLLSALAGRTRAPLVVHLPVGHSSDVPLEAAGESRWTAMLVADRDPTIEAGQVDWTGALSVGGTVRAGYREAQIPAYDPEIGGDGLLVRLLKHLGEVGYRGVSLDHYGAMGEAEFTAARQAIRFARRSAGD